MKNSTKAAILFADLARMSVSSLNVQEKIKELLVEALTRTNGNRARAADLLGISQQTVFTWIDKYSLRGRFPLHEDRRADSRVRSFYQRDMRAAHDHN